jgi:hypothetical protein
MSDNNYDAREFQTSNFLKKEDLKRDGPQRLRIHAVEKAEGLTRKSGQPAKDVLQLVFHDERRLTLGTQANLKRLIEWFGPQTSAWLNQTIEAYYSPDVRGPSGEEGGIRLRRPEGAAAVVVASPPPLDFAATLADGGSNDIPF